MVAVIEWLKAVLLLVWSYDGVKVIVIGVLLNVVLAVAVAIRTGTFSFQVLGEFLTRQLMPYVIVYFAFKLFGEGIGMEGVSLAVWGLIAAMIASSIVEKLSELGVPIPEGVMRMVRRPQRIVEFRRIDSPAVARAEVIH
jgi:hypothetical protein